MSYSFDRVWYSTITASVNTEFTWNYCDVDFENELNELLVGKKIKKVYVGLDGYLEGRKLEENYYDFTYMGGRVLFIFDENIALELEIYAEGMIAHRILSVSDLTIHSTKNHPPNDMVLSNEYFYDIKDEFVLSFEEKRIVEIAVDGTNDYAFLAEGYDKDKATLAMYQNKLPSNIHFVLDNDVTISLIGDQIENFYLYLEKK